MLTGVSLANEYRFELTGRADGPSAGALTTAGVLSLILGDDMLSGVSMTGTINPTGTIGPVGGIPQKIQGVIDSGKYTKILIPAGQRYDYDFKGNQVDVVKLGASGNVEVAEVADIYEAYRHLTGKDIPAPASAVDPRLDETGYSKFKSAADSELANFESAVTDFAALSLEVQDVAWPIYLDAAESAGKARRLQSQGLQGGAFINAMQANFLMQATTSAYTTAQRTLHQGVQTLITKLSAVDSVETKFLSFLDQLSNYEPKTLTDVENLVTAYGNAFDAYSLLKYAQNNLDQLLDGAASNSYPSLEALLDAALPFI